MGAHQVDKGKDRFFFAHPFAFDQEPRRIGERFGRVAFEAERRLPKGDHERGEGKGQQRVGAGK